MLLREIFRDSILIKMYRKEYQVIWFLHILLLFREHRVRILTAENILITHDIYEPLTDDLIGNDTTSIQLEYNLEFTTGTIRSQWQTSTTGECILYTYEPNAVISVLEKNTGNGYVRVNELSDLLTRNGAYYHDLTSKNLYIRTTRDNTISNINEMTIIVQNK